MNSLSQNITEAKNRNSSPKGSSKFRVSGLAGLLAPRGMGPTELGNQNKRENLHQEKPQTPTMLVPHNTRTGRRGEK